MSNSKSFAVKQAFRLSLQTYLSTLPEDADKLDYLSGAHEQLKHILYATPVASPGAVQEIVDRAELAAHLETTVGELRSEMEQAKSAEAKRR